MIAPDEPQPIGPPPLNCGIDLDLIRRVVLRCPSYTSLDAAAPATMLGLLDRIPQFVGVNRPIVVGMAITEAIKVDREGCMRLLNDAGVATQIRQEVADRKSGVIPASVPLVVADEPAKTEAQRHV